MKYQKVVIFNLVIIVIGAALYYVVSNQWEGAPPGGHHREGTLKFSAVTPRPTFIELNIQTTDSTKEANLRWNI